MFDAGVNCGIHSGIIFLQEALNLLNNNGRRYPDIVVDGNMGPMTMEALRLALLSAPDFERAILKAQNGEQYGHYKRKAMKNPVLEKYFRGWLLGRID
jgi:lysozyme family protein